MNARLCMKDNVGVMLKDKIEVLTAPPLLSMIHNIIFKNNLKYNSGNVIIIQRESTHSKGGCSEFRLSMSLRTAPILWVRQDRHFYFRLFLLLRKASNATINLPKDISNMFLLFTYLTNHHLHRQSGIINHRFFRNNLA